MPYNEESNYHKDPNWDTERKQQARLATIIAPYRRLFGQALPTDKQYWTMCGAHYRFVDESVVRGMGEMTQLVEAELLQPHQFVGVDRDGTIIENNRQVYPEIMWLHGDFYAVMAEAASKHHFNPAVVNYDGVMESKFGTRYMAQIMQFLDHNTEGDLLFVANFVLQTPYRKQQETHGREIIDSLVKHYIPRDHWHLVDTYYAYRGGANQRSHTTMGSVILAKIGHDMKRTVGRRLDDISGHRDDGGKTE